MREEREERGDLAERERGEEEVPAGTSRGRGEAGGEREGGGLGL